MTLLCLITLAGAFIGLRSPDSVPATAIRVDSAASIVPVTAEVPAPLTPAPTVAAAISLHELAMQLKTRNATSTTRPRTTSTTAKPATTTTGVPATTTTAPAPAATTTTTPLTPLTTLVEAVVPPPAAVTPTVVGTDSGIASWFNAPDATCAHRTLPKGTIIKVTRVHNGAVASCKVNDWGPTLETGRLIDLSLDTFEKLAPRGIGLIDVTIEW
ncbi:MAG: septal ring lytic transglycosylase RlpA family protein [Acidimicrobiales bacterium]